MDCILASVIWPLDPQRVVVRKTLLHDSPDDYYKQQRERSAVNVISSLQYYCRRQKDLILEFRERHGALESDGLVLGAFYVTTKTGAIFT